MLCENCQQADATAHLGGWQTRPGTFGEEQQEPIEHHYCEACAQELRQSNPLLKTPPGAQKLSLEVISVSADRIELRTTKPVANLTQDRFSFLSSRFPAQYAVPGMEFEIIVTET